MHLWKGLWWLSALVGAYGADMRESTTSVSWVQPVWMAEVPGRLTTQIVFSDVNGDGTKDLVIGGVFAESGHDPFTEILQENTENEQIYELVSSAGSPTSLSLRPREMFIDVINGKTGAPLRAPHTHWPLLLDMNGPGIGIASVSLPTETRNGFVVNDFSGNILLISPNGEILNETSETISPSGSSIEEALLQVRRRRPIDEHNISIPESIIYNVKDKLCAAKGREESVSLIDTQHAHVEQTQKPESESEPMIALQAVTAYPVVIHSILPGQPELWMLYVEWQPIDHEWRYCSGSEDDSNGASIAITGVAMSLNRPTNLEGWRKVHEEHPDLWKHFLFDVEVWQSKRHNQSYADIERSPVTATMITSRDLVLFHLRAEFNLTFVHLTLENLMLTPMGKGVISSNGPAMKNYVGQSLPIQVGPDVNNRNAGEPATRKDFFILTDKGILFFSMEVSKKNGTLIPIDGGSFPHELPFVEDTAMMFAAPPEKKEQTAQLEGPQTQLEMQIMDVNGMRHCVSMATKQSCQIPTTVSAEGNKPGVPLQAVLMWSFSRTSHPDNLNRIPRKSSYDMIQSRETSEQKQLKMVSRGPLEAHVVYLEDDGDLISYAVDAHGRPLPVRERSSSQVTVDTGHHKEQTLGNLGEALHLEHGASVEIMPGAKPREIIALSETGFLYMAKIGIREIGRGQETSLLLDPARLFELSTIVDQVGDHSDEQTLSRPFAPLHNTRYADRRSAALMQEHQFAGGLIGGSAGRQGEPRMISQSLLRLATICSEQREPIRATSIVPFLFRIDVLPLLDPSLPVHVHSHGSSVGPDSSGGLVNLRREPLTLVVRLGADVLVQKEMAMIAGTHSLFLPGGGERMVAELTVEVFQGSDLVSWDSCAVRYHEDFFVILTYAVFIPVICAKLGLIVYIRREKVMGSRT
eukprot:Clim_evm13s168 gene=Clim_evmTU13s168